MPRPKKHPEQSRTCRIPNARLSEAERDAILKRAEQTGLSPCEYVRRACLEGKIVVTGQPRIMDAVIMRELGAIGNNLNQLTRMEHIHAAYDQQRLQRLLDSLEDIAMQIVEAR